MNSAAWRDAAHTRCNQLLCRSTSRDVFLVQLDLDCCSLIGRDIHFDQSVSDDQGQIIRDCGCWAVVLTQAVSHILMSDFPYFRPLLCYFYDAFIATSKCIFLQVKL